MVAKELHLQESTIGSHLEHIYSILFIKTRAELTAWVVSHGHLDVAER
jgi:DNA-binding NarL/FixJ family response regulator